MLTRDDSPSSTDEVIAGGQRAPKTEEEKVVEAVKNYFPSPKRRTSQGAEYPALTEALVGRFAAHHGAVARAILDHIDFLDAGIARLDEQVAASLEPFRAAVTVLETIPGVGTRVAETIGPAPRAAHGCSAQRLVADNMGAGLFESDMLLVGALRLTTKQSPPQWREPAIDE